MTTAAAARGNAGEKRIELYLSRGQAGIMAFWGVGMLVGAGLLSLVLLDERVPLAWKVVVGLLVAYLAMLGAAYIAGARRWLRHPVFTLTGEGLHCHEEPSTTAIPLGAIERIETREARGVERTVVVWSEGRVEIPATLRHYEAAVAALRERIAEAKEPPEIPDTAPGRR